jgi:hypothetical protein
MLVLAGSFISADKAITLAYTFKVGDEYVWAQKTKQNVKQTLPGMGDVSFDVNLDATFKLKVIELTSTGARIEVQYSRIKVDSNSPMVNINFDSDSDNTNMQNKVVRSMIGKAFYFDLTNRGLVEKVEGTENLLSGIEDLGLDEAAQQKAKLMLEETVGGSSVRASLETGFLSYPGAKTKVGDTWKNTGTLPLNFPVSINNEWTFKKIDGSIATLDATGSLNTIDKDKITTLPNGIKSKVDLGGRQLVVGKVNVKTGWPTEIKVSSDIEGKMVLLAGGMIPSDMDIPMKIATESHYTITKK